MKIIAFLQRRLPWINLPGAILMMLLQRAPALNVVAVGEEMVIAAPVSSVLRSVAVVAAALGAINSMAGATQFMGSQGTSTGITLAAGTPVSVSYTLGTPDTQPDPTGSWTITLGTGSSWPPGLDFSGLTSPGTVEVKFLHLGGTPTTAGTYVLKFMAMSVSGTYSAGPYTYTITVTGSSNVAPSIGTQPTNQSVTAGASASFTAAATGTPTPTLQWQRQPAGAGSFTNLGEGGSYTGTTTGTLTVSGTATNMSGDQFRCVATNTAGTATTNAATLTVNPVTAAPAITTQPTNQTVTAGTNASFTAAASGGPAPTLQWQREAAGAGAFTNLSEGGNYTGTTTGTLTVGGTVTGMTGDQFRCVATNGSGTATTNAATLTVNPVPVINSISYNATSFPATATVGAALTFTYNVTNTGTNAWGIDHYLVLRDSTNANLDFASLDGVAPGNSTTVTLHLTVPANPGTYTYYVQGLQNNVAYFSTRATLNLMVNPAAAGVGFTADFNGDGKADILWSNTSSGDRYIWLMNGGSVTASIFLGTIAPQWTPVAGDFDGDGKADILWSNTSSGDRYIWLMNGGSVAGSVFLGTIAPQWTALTGDFNGDSKADILWSNTSSGDRYIWLMNGGSVAGSVFLGTIATQWTPVTGDFSGDGKADILWSNTSSGDRYIWLMNGGSVAGSVFLGTIAPQWAAATADFDGDGKADILWSNTSIGDRYIWLMNGGSVAGSVFLGTIGIEWTPVTGDLDGNAKRDIVWSNTSSGDRYIWLMNGGSVAGSVFLGTIPTQWQVGD